MESNLSMEEHYLDNFRIFDQESNMKEIHTTEQDYYVKDKIYDDTTINSLGLLSSLAAAEEEMAAAERDALSIANANTTTNTSTVTVTAATSATVASASTSDSAENEPVDSDAMMDLDMGVTKKEPDEPTPETVEYIVVDATEKPEEEIEILEEYQEPGSDSGETLEETTDDSKTDTMYYFKCSYCENIYGNKKDLNAHQIAEHMHKCQTCGVTFKDDKSLQEHSKQNHADTKLFMCGVCKVILEKRYLGQHMKKHLQQQVNETHTCKICKDTFSRKMLLSVHISQKHSIFTKDYVCQICKLPYDENNNELHSSCHWFCSICSKTFMTKASMVCHSRMRHNRNQGKFVCEFCGKHYWDKATLEYHSRVHIGEEKPITTPTTNGGGGTVATTSSVGGSHVAANSNVNSVANTANSSTSDKTNQNGPVLFLLQL